MRRGLVARCSMISTAALALTPRPCSAVAAKSLQCGVGRAHQAQQRDCWRAVRVDFDNSRRTCRSSGGGAAQSQSRGICSCSWHATVFGDPTSFGFECDSRSARGLAAVRTAEFGNLFHGCTGRGVAFSLTDIEERCVTMSTWESCCCSWFCTCRWRVRCRRQRRSRLHKPKHRQLQATRPTSGRKSLH